MKITNADQVLVLLEAHLKKYGRTKRAGAPAGGRERTDALTRARAIAAQDQLSETEIERALIAGLLEDEFGAGIVNDANFQKLVDEVANIVRRDPDANRLLQESIGQIVSPEAS